LEKYQIIEIDELLWYMNKNCICAIIDARPEKEFKKGRISGSRNFPSRQFANFLPSILDFIEGGVDRLVIATDKSNDSRDIMFNLLKKNIDIDILFVNFEPNDWKILGQSLEH
jgi:rhodanese-related sulfurtransferase